jgi:predicted TIM-barrel fold metal-dependent hydrolase
MADNFDWLISVDDHVVEPPNVWQDRLPKKFRDVGPRLVRDAQGEAWVYEDARIPTSGLSAAAGKKKEEFSVAPLTYEEMRSGCYDSKARLEDMDRDGVLASLCFPTLPRFCGQQFYEGKDKELSLECVKAYNDFILEEWCGAAPGRFIPMIIMPLWDPALAVAEIERTAAMGARAIAFSENPHQLGLPSIHDENGYWEPVWAVANEAELPICCHIGSSSKLPQTSPDTPFIVTTTLVPMNAIYTCVDWLWSGLFIRYPNLKLCLSEGGIGWMPYVLERAEYTLDRHGSWSAKTDYKVEYSEGEGLKLEARESTRAANFTVPPRQLFKDHIFGCFIDDRHGTQSLDEIGVDNVMIETDYPHTDSSWPNSREAARKMLSGRTDEEIHKILRGNAERVFNFVPAEPPHSRSSA